MFRWVKCGFYYKLKQIWWCLLDIPQFIFVTYSLSFHNLDIFCTVTTAILDSICRQTNYLPLFITIVWNFVISLNKRGPPWPWSYGSWIDNYLCNQCLSSLMLWVRISIRARCTTLCDKVGQWLEADRWFSLGPLVSFSTTEIVLKVALNTIKQTKQTTSKSFITVDITLRSQSSQI